MADDKTDDKKAEAEAKKEEDELIKLSEEVKTAHEKAVNARDESKKKEEEEANRPPVAAATLNLR